MRPRELIEEHVGRTQVNLRLATNNSSPSAV